MTIYQYSATGNIFGNTSVTISNRIFTYSDPTIIPYSQEDFGSTSNQIISSENYGDFFSITESDNYESILIFETLSPFGTYTFSGSALEAYSTQIPEDAQLFSISGSALEAYSAQTPEDTQLFSISGSALEAYSKSTYQAFGSSLFSLLNCVESRTYNYDELVPPIPFTDYGNIIENADQSVVEYGTITSNTGSILDFAFIIDQVEDNILPFGKVTLSGSALCEPNYRLYIDGTALIKATYSDDVVGIGTLTFSGSALETYSTQIPEDTQLFSISGSLVEKNTESYVGLGTLTFSGSTLEAYSAQTPEDTQLFSISGSALEAYSAQTPEDTVLYTFSNTPLVHPFVDYTPHYGIEKNIGIGTVGIEIFGTLIENNTGSYFGSGNLFGFGTKLESVTYDYNETSIEVSEDYGLIDDNFELFQDYQSITSEGAVDDFGLITDPVSVANTPFGTLTFSGSGLEAYSAQTPEDLVLYTFSGSSIDREIQVYGLDYVTSGTLTFSNTPLVHPFVDYTPHYGIEKNIGIGTVGIQISGSGLEAYSAQTPEDTVLYTFSGSALEAYSAQTPEDLVLYTFSGSLVEKNTESYVGLGTLTFSGSALEAYSAQTPEDTQLFSISGSALEAYSAQTPEDLVLYTFSGSLVEKNTESYVGLGTLTFSGSAVEENTESYVGIGNIKIGKIYVDGNQFSSDQITFDSILETFDNNSFIPSSALESFSAQTPEDTVLYTFSGQAQTNRNREFVSQTVTLTFSNTPLVHPFVDYTPHYGIEKNIGIGTFGIRFVSGVGFIPDSEGNLRDARTYSNVYPGNDKVPGTGIGTFKFDEINNIAKYSPLTPYTGRGLISLSGIGLESFSITNYDGSGLISISGISSNRPISVYQDYITSGIITISQQTQPIIEKNTESYVGLGTLTFSRSLVEKNTESYVGLGTLTFSGSALEAYSAQTPEDTQLFSISGSALEAYSAQTPEDTVLYTFSGSLTESRTYGYFGSGTQSTLSGNAHESIGVNPPATGNIKFVTNTSDHIDITCDSEEITCDNENSAVVSFVANPPESTQLFTIFGSATTKERNIYEFVGVGNLTFSGFIVEKETDSYVGVGTLFAISGGTDKTTNSYDGIGSLFGISGSSESKSSQTPEDTILITISGTASTKLESEYSYSGITTIYITGSAVTAIESDYPYTGTGTITLFGELVYPNIQFIPSPKGFGLFELSGISSNSGSYVDELPGDGKLFAFSGAFESFSESTYIGLGTIYTQSIVGIAISNPFQIPRTYIIII